MRRYHLRRAIGPGKLSGFEHDLLIAGILVVVAGVVAAFAHGDAGGLARLLGVGGLASVAICAAMRAFRLYRAAVRASLPTSVGKVNVPLRPARGFGATTVGFAVLLPLGAAVGVLALVDWAWVLLAGLLLFGCGGVPATWAREASDEELSYRGSSDTATGLLERLCMRADVPAPELVVEHGPVPNVWMARGRIHVTSPVLRLLDDGELEAVLAHEVAHLARRDAVVMEVCSAPSRLLLGFAWVLSARLPRWTWTWLTEAPTVPLTWPFVLMWILAVLCVPPSFVIGWISRLSVLGMSRAREFTADAAAVTLTGRPSALASALMKLEGNRDWAPRSDLRQVEAYAVLCIVAATGSRLGRLFSTHPPTAARVKRLEGIEIRMQAGPHS